MIKDRKAKKGERSWERGLLGSDTKVSWPFSRAFVVLLESRWSGIPRNFVKT